MAIRNSISRARISNPRSGHNRFHVARRLVRVLCGAAAILMVFPHLSTLGTTRILASRNAKQPPLRLLTKVEEIRNLSREEAARGHPVDVQAVVTFADLDRQILFVQDRTGGIFVDVPLESNLSLKAGELVDIKGSTEIPDFAPNIGKARISMVGHSALPAPIRLSAESLESVTMDCLWVEVEGVVRSLEVKGVSQYARQYWEQDISTPKFRTPNPTTFVRVIVAVGLSRIPVYVLHSQALNPESYLGARVRVRGVRGSFFNQANQVVGVNLFVPGLAQIQVVEAPPPIAAVGMSSLMQYAAHETLNQRVKVEGVVTLQDPGRALFIASAGSSTRVETRQGGGGAVLNPGDYVEVVGFPAMGDFSGLLQDAAVHRLRPGPEVSPVPTTAEKALAAESDGGLVRIDGRLVGVGVAPEGATWALEAGSVPFLARLPVNSSFANRNLPPIGEGSLLRLTGVCVVNADQNGRPESFEILLRSPRDVMVLEMPAWWTARRALTLLGFLLAVVLLVLGWVYLLRRRVNQQAELIRQKTAAEVAIAKRFEYVARATNDALWEVDLIADTLWGSPTFTAIYGSLPERIPADTTAMAEGVHPDDRAKVAAGISAAVQNRQTKWEAEYRQRCVDGSYANVYARACIERDDGGRPKRLIGALTDISARKRADEELRASRQLLQTTLYSLRDAVFVLSFDEDEILDCNPAATEIFGYSREEMVGRGRQLLHVDEAALLEFKKRLTAAVAEKGYLQQFEFRLRRNDGTIFPSSHSVTPLRDNQGNHTAWVSLVQDITERKLAEEALKNAEEKFRKAFNASPEPMAIRTIPDGRYVEVNDALLRATGRRREEVHGKTVTEVGFRMMPEDLSRMTAILDRDGKVRDFEAHLEWTSGQVNHALISAEQIELSGEPHLLLVARDITDRRRMEKALEDSQRCYQDFISQSVDAVWRFEFEPPIAVDLPEQEFLASALRGARLVETNDALARLLGFSSAADVIGKYLNKLIQESDDGRLASYRSMLQGGFRPRTIAFQTTGPDGKPQYLLRTEVPIVEDGRLVRMWGMTRDITELRLAEEALRESEQRYRTLFENSPVGIYRTTPDGRVLAGNPAFARMMGYSSFEELASRDLNAEGFEPEYSRGQFQEALERSGRIAGLECQWRRRDGSVIFVRENALAIRDDAGRILYYEGVVEDITERKRAEQKAAQLAAIVESSNDAIFSANLEGIITSWNKGATLLYGYEESEVIGRNVSILVPPGVENDAPQLLQRIQLGEQTEHQEAVRQRRDGQRIYMSRTISPVRDGEGRIVAASTIARDITASRQAQEELRAAHDRLAKEVTERTRAEAEIVALSQRLITAQEEERTRLARELHDDLSQQIAAVGIGLSNIRRMIPERQREGREEAERTFQRLKQLGEGIRRLSHQLHPAILEHSGLAVALESYCAEFKSLTGVSAVVQADGRLDNVPANPALGIFRIAQEALQNVWKHSGTKEVVINLARSGGQLRLCISDQGSGFDPAHRHKSKGLGLVSMRERAKLLRGTLTIESAKGRGTTVTAAIPLHAPRSVRVSQAKPFLAAAAGSGA